MNKLMICGSILLLATLSGCVVEPVGPGYGYGRHHYYYGDDDYPYHERYHEHDWRRDHDWR